MSSLTIAKALVVPAAVLISSTALVGCGGGKESTSTCEVENCDGCQSGKTDKCQQCSTDYTTYDQGLTCEYSGKQDCPAGFDPYKLYEQVTAPTQSAPGTYKECSIKCNPCTTVCDYGYSWGCDYGNCGKDIFLDYLSKWCRQELDYLTPDVCSNTVSGDCSQKYTYDKNWNKDGVAAEQYNLALKDWSGNTFNSQPWYTLCAQASTNKWCVPCKDDAQCTDKNQGLPTSITGSQTWVCTKGICVAKENSCNIAFCETCAGVNTCSKCQVGWSVNDSGFCEPLPDCTSAPGCSSCDTKTGYDWDRDVDMPAGWQIGPPQNRAPVASDWVSFVDSTLQQREDAGCGDAVANYNTADKCNPADPALIVSTPADRSTLTDNDLLRKLYPGRIVRYYQQRNKAGELNPGKFYVDSIGKFDTSTGTTTGLITGCWPGGSKGINYDNDYDCDGNYNKARFGLRAGTQTSKYCSACKAGYSHNAVTGVCTLESR